MKEHLVKIKLSNVKPNPNRDLAFNPYNEEKIAALMASIGETGFWTNVIVRQSPDGKGYEQAYGHHRIESARRSGITEADFVVRELDENMMLKMMELENQEDYRYCPLSLLETCKAVVKALAAGRIAPFYRVEDAPKGITREGSKWKAQAYVNGKKTYLGAFDTPEEATEAYRSARRDTGYVRYAPSFVPAKVRSKAETSVEPDREYTAYDIGDFLGRKSGSGTAGAQVRAALDALCLLEVKAIKTSDIKDMNWLELGKFVADIKQRRERIILRETHTRKEIVKINAESQRIQAEQKKQERKAEDERKALVKKLAEAKKEEDTKKAKEIRDRLDAQDEAAAKAEETFKEKNKVLDAKVQQVKQHEAEAKEADKYLPIRKEADRIVHKLERRDEEAEIKALARRALNANDRERLRQAALKLGEWYNTWVADLFLPPLSTKSLLAEYQNREEAKRRAESKENK